MSLSPRLTRYFSGALRQRGLDYFSRRRVHITGGSEDCLEAEVRGSSLYAVSLNYADGSLTSSCECMYFDSEGVCKHVWAAILAADNSGYLREAARAPSLKFQDEHPDVPMPFGLTRPGPAKPGWRKQVERILEPQITLIASAASLPEGTQLLYVVEADSPRPDGGLVLSLCTRSLKQNGQWAKPKDLSMRFSGIASLPEPEDREILAQVAGGRAYLYGNLDWEQVPRQAVLTGTLAAVLVPRMARTGRCVFRAKHAAEELQPLAWDDQGAWRFVMELVPMASEEWTLDGWLERGDERMNIREADLLVNGLVFKQRKVAPFDSGAYSNWIQALRTSTAIAVGSHEVESLLGLLMEDERTPPLRVPEAWRSTEEPHPLRPALRIHEESSRTPNQLWAELMFEYENRRVNSHDRGRGFYISEERKFIPRDAEAERSARKRLLELGLRPEPWLQEERWKLAASRLPETVRDLVAAGWHVEAEGKVFRSPGRMSVNVSSGIDWFELRGEVDYGDAVAKLPELLTALRRGNGMVLLDDGTYGLLPEEWLARFAPLAGLGAKEEDHLRFRRNQAGLLDALLAAQPDLRVDETFARVRERLASFGGVAAAGQPEGFVGKLRDYQREGVGWMAFLREFGFGGCLADDMGVGKTAQVLAALESRRAAGAPASLVVAPKSLMFNWREEAARFTPQLRVLEYTGVARDTAAIAEHDLVLTTYGTMLRDIVHLQKIEFEYVVLDEAQAIKNSSTSSSKAVRLLRGQHRLALSGTPVENHLGELWSLFEFLNPGMLGEAKVLKLAGGLARNPSEEARQLLAQALRPFILRRTKKQVAKELPEKTEQTIFCELEGPQRKLYDELKRHYRDKLLSRVESQGLARSKMHVLEALLRLRQAACHPGLIDQKRTGEPSAKLDVLLEQLSELREEGHKALVFSQFTSLLAIVRTRLDALQVNYEYLDGGTRDRQARVEHFQNDPACGLFLISLKAGGLGLNLTAAEYVFLLDPWWNPAVEAQAVDRAHRIGQERPVFAYRLIARDTVEEKVLELQKTKRELADAILGGDNSLIRDLKREDLELLLS